MRRRATLQSGAVIALVVDTTPEPQQEYLAKRFEDPGRCDI